MVHGSSGKHRNGVSDPNTDKKDKRPQSALSPIIVTTGITCVGASLNFFGNNPKIIYLGAFGLCLLIMWGAHFYVSSIEPKTENPIQPNESTRIDSKGVTQLDSVRAPLIVEQREPYGWVVHARNNGAVDLVNFSVMLRKWGKYSNVDREFALRTLDHALFALPKLEGTSATPRGAWIFQYEPFRDDPKKLLRVMDGVKAVDSGVYKAIFAISADGYTERVEEHFFEWHPGQSATKATDPTNP